MTHDLHGILTWASLVGLVLLLEGVGTELLSLLSAANLISLFSVSINLVSFPGNPKGLGTILVPTLSLNACSDSAGRMAAAVRSALPGRFRLLLCHQKVSGL